MPSSELSPQIPCCRWLVRKWRRSWNLRYKAVLFCWPHNLVRLNCPTMPHQSLWDAGYCVASRRAADFRPSFVPYIWVQVMAGFRQMWLKVWGQDEVLWCDWWMTFFIWALSQAVAATSYPVWLRKRILIRVTSTGRSAPEIFRSAAWSPPKIPASSPLRNDFRQAPPKCPGPAWRWPQPRAFWTSVKAPSDGWQMPWRWKSRSGASWGRSRSGSRQGTMAVLDGFGNWWWTGGLQSSVIKWDERCISILLKNSKNLTQNSSMPSCPHLFSAGDPFQAIDLPEAEASTVALGSTPQLPRLRARQPASRLPWLRLALPLAAAQPAPAHGDARLRPEADATAGALCHAARRHGAWRWLHDGLWSHTIFG